MILTTKGTQFSDIQNAINALPSTGGVIYMGPGTYTLSTTRVVTKSNVSIKGSGVGITTITIPDAFGAAIGTNPMTGETGEFMFVNTSVGNTHTAYQTIDENISFEDLTLDGNGSGQTRKVHGIGLQFVDKPILKNVEFINFGTANLTPDTINTEVLGDLRSKGFVLKNCTNSDINTKLEVTDGGQVVLTEGSYIKITSNNGTSHGLYLSDNVSLRLEGNFKNNEQNNLKMTADYSEGLNNLTNEVSIISNGTVHSGTLSGHSEGVYVSDAVDLKLHDSSILKSYGTGLYLNNVITSHITDNNIYNNGQGIQGNGITMLNVDNSYINNNNIYDDQSGHTQYDAISSEGTSTGNTLSNYKVGNTNSN